MSAVNLSSILEYFRLQAEPVSEIRWGEGHINETYFIETRDHRPDYILQKINGTVFRDIPGMMRNIEIVCSHLRNKLSETPGRILEKESLTLVSTKKGTPWHEDDEGNGWRLYNYIPDSITYRKIEDGSVAFEAGGAIGKFQAMLSDLPVPLVVTIPDFHNINHRISQYDEAIRDDRANRRGSVGEEIHFAEEIFPGMKAYYQKLKAMAVLRPTHNDTKLNNVLFHENGKALCLIDLDTVMPGYVHFDYGDALRTMANTALEDEKDLSKVAFNFDYYQAFTAGYLGEMKDFLNAGEMELLPFSPVYITFMIGLRFLTDYLNGDVYFRVHYPEHNLVRARVQFRLVQEMEQKLL